MIPSPIRHSLFAVTILSALLLAPSALATTGCNAVGWDDRHVDVQGCDLYYPAIAWMYDEGIAQGELVEMVPAGERRAYHPERPINRAEFTKLVLLASGQHTAPPPCATDPFPDVSKDAWYAPYVCAAKERGIISGFPDGTFKPGININYANGSKILVKSFDVATNAQDVTAVDGQEVWYKPYVLALLRENAVAPTVGAFDHLITRGEMAEMIYRLAHDKPSYVMPSEQTDGDPLGMGYNNPYSLEMSLGLWVSPPDPPYFFSKSATTLLGKMPRLEGYRFFHTLSEVRCTASGLWEHCTPVFIDWSIGMYVTEASVAQTQRSLLLPGEEETLYFGGKPGRCIRHGIEGEYTDICFVALNDDKTLIVERNLIDTDFAYRAMPGITPVHTSDAWFARIRGAMQFAQ